MSTRNSYSHNKGTPSSSGTTTPSLSSSWTVPVSVSNAVTGLLRRFSTETSSTKSSPPNNSSPHFASSHLTKSANGVYTPPYRSASPFQPPPLYPVSLKGYHLETPESAKLLSTSLAEEIRLLVPARLQLVEEWNLVYSLEEDGVSLGTLYKKCDALRGLRNGFVLVVKDGDGGLFGAYLNEAPHVSPHYFGTGECFLWRASFLSGSQMNLQMNLPLPPSANTTDAQRHTTIASPTLLPPHNTQHHNSNHSPTASTSSLAASERIRFKAFPYSGVNDYLMLCETGFFSLGGGDGHYGLWLDDSFEKGISSHCLTFGNEPLSEEGEKFDILGVELWSLGNTL